MTSELPGGHDGFLVANVAHYWSPDTNVALLERIRKAASPSGRLLLVDFWTDPTHTRPVQAALMAGEFAVPCATATSTASRRSGRGCPRLDGGSSSIESSSGLRA
ncbi:MAG: hypothetical protein M3450_05125 [Actinomycetota bacterium]|nr:hypothetical protein [Actinomycetota bacterium]MDQ3640854.1 hypothetical protein [Actinomycetota bacterium]